jgi:hypothetical protein
VPGHGCKFGIRLEREFGRASGNDVIPTRPLPHSHISIPKLPKYIRNVGLARALLYYFIICHACHATHASIQCQGVSDTLEREYFSTKPEYPACASRYKQCNLGVAL